MKNTLHSIFCIMLLALSSCAKMPELEDTSIGSGKIILNIMTNDGPVVKSQDTDPEQKVEWLDIFIFDEENNLYHMERCDKKTNPDYGYGQFVTQKQRGDFGVNSKYFVFVVANCEADFTGVKNLADLQRTIVTHDNLHLSGFGYEGAPNRFIMDGVAYTGDSEPEMPMSMVLNNGDLVANTELKATLRRAASKIVVNISQGDNVEFRKELVDEESSAAGRTAYSFYQLPIGTSVIAPLQGMASYVDAKQTTDDIQTIDNKTFFWDERNNITIIGYAYANDWSSTELTKETSLLLNIPMMWDENNDLTDGKEAARPNNWFKIPLSRESKFDRNKCYQVNIKINAIGAETKSTAIELDDIEYVTVDWIGNVINVGDNTTGPEYLMLNKEVVEIFNSNFDFTSLSFTSSSPIESITLKSIDGDEYSAYYYNKYSNPIELSNAIKATITATAPDGVLNGNIAITSPMMPSNQAEIDKAIAALGGAPVPPTLPEGITPPQEPDGKPKEPEVVEDPGEQPAEPDPNDYVPGTNLVYSYRYNESTGKFQRKRHLSSRDWENIDDPQEYIDAVNAYNNYESLKAAYDQYVIKKEAYDAALAEWQSTDAYKQYLADLEAYENNPALKTYQELYALYETNLQAYNDAVAAIRSTANGTETHYNSIRYVEFEVKNTQGLTATFVVKQYPTIYITNVVGWYSYRDDFKSTDPNPTTYEYEGDGIVGVSVTGTPPSYTYNTSSSGFWRSKVNRDAQNTDADSQSTYDIDYYEYENGRLVYEGAESSGNARMYHIRVSSTSPEYTVGKPKIVSTDDLSTPADVESGVTDPSSANALLVSPSFMTASRLGFVNNGVTGTNFGDNERTLSIFREHCRNYVEVTSDGTVYNDWRLPTAAEIGIIIGLQGSGSGDNTKAIDYLLNAYYYFAANGPVRNSGGTSSGYSVRCVRDAF